MNLCSVCGKILLSAKTKTGKCYSCAKKGILNPHYSTGVSTIKHYCVDCGEEISCHRNAQRCKSCENKRRHREGILNSKRFGKEANSYIDGRSLKNYFCLDCGKKINWQTAVYGAGHCYSCKNKGAGNPSWIDGRSFLPYPPEWTEELKYRIRKRDNFTCQLCGTHRNKFKKEHKGRLEVHHIDYDKQNCAEDNLTSLCSSCHKKTGENRDHWKEYFNGKNSTREIKVL